MHIDPAGVQLLFVDLQAFLTAYSATEKAAMIGKAAGALARTASSNRPHQFGQRAEPPLPMLDGAHGRDTDAGAGGQRRLRQALRLAR